MGSVKQLINNTAVEITFLKKVTDRKTGRKVGYYRVAVGENSLIIAAYCERGGEPPTFDNQPTVDEKELN